MKTNNKPAPEITPAQFEEAMQRYYAAGLRGLEINKAIECEVNGILEKYEPEIQSNDHSKAAAFKLVQNYCTANKRELFSKRRSIGTPWGIAGFRLGTPRLKALKGTDWNTIVRKLKEKLPAYVRLSEEPAKDMLLADRNKETVAPLLVQLGIQVVQDEQFYIEMKKAA